MTTEKATRLTKLWIRKECHYMKKHPAETVGIAYGTVLMGLVSSILVNL
jgi:hypothetical protein|tara:strand:+ start:177 stop:323 length:147 start_codon:yes stop_codon:yes gene_type:complete